MTITLRSVVFVQSVSVSSGSSALVATADSKSRYIAVPSIRLVVLVGKLVSAELSSTAWLLKKLIPNKPNIKQRIAKEAPVLECIGSSNIKMPQIKLTSTIKDDASNVVAAGAAVSREEILCQFLHLQRNGFCTYGLPADLPIPTPMARPAVFTA